MDWRQRQGFTFLLFCPALLCGPHIPNQFLLGILFPEGNRFGVALSTLLLTAAEAKNELNPISIAS
jgi:hypothetical protein